MSKPMRESIPDSKSGRCKGSGANSWEKSREAADSEGRAVGVETRAARC